MRTRPKGDPIRREPPRPAQVRIEEHPAIPELAREVVAGAFAEGSSPGTAMAIASRTAELARQLTGELASGEEIACRAGCTWCCTLTVIATSAPEVLRIAEYLRASLTPHELAALTKRVGRRDERLRAMPEERRPRARLACALLLNQRCSVYPVRPLACRGMTSASAEACEASYRAGWTRPIPNGPRHLGIAAGVRQGVEQGLGAAGLPARDLDLTAALRIALETPDAVDRWLAGEPIFAEAAI